MDLPSKRKVKKTLRKVEKKVKKTTRKVVKAAKAKAKRAGKATRKDRKHLAKHLKLTLHDATDTVVDAAKA